MRRRREAVEHPFATIKARIGATHFLDVCCGDREFASRFLHQRGVLCELTFGGASRDVVGPFGHGGGGARSALGRGLAQSGSARSQPLLGAAFTAMSQGCSMG
jgi:hypothetical protein